MHREARVDVVHAFISNVMQATRAVCEIPAQNVGILRQSGRWGAEGGVSPATRGSSLAGLDGNLSVSLSGLAGGTGGGRPAAIHSRLRPGDSAGHNRVYRVAAFPFVEGIGSAPAYWRDGGTIDAYWEAHIDLLDPQADFQLSQSQEPLSAASAQGPAVILRRSSPRRGRSWHGWGMQCRRRCAPGCGPGQPPTPGRPGPGL